MRNTSVKSSDGTHSSRGGDDTIVGTNTETKVSKLKSIMSSLILMLKL